ncbi:DUF2855 family protein [Undibacterium sp. Ji83W]|uniref:DUF2855 family protein n=1 Tax=Undibacterium sp. Ji83W TaxID=3413043 RepID=UPI003BF0F50E
MKNPAKEFIVNKSNLLESRFKPLHVPAEAELQNGQVVLQVERFAFTSNNVTYAAFGTAMHYWNFFPTDEGWGNIPVWGFGDVLASKAEGVEVGERFYGYYPMATHLTVQATRVSPGGFVDGSEHRQAMHGLYNHYVRTSTDPGYTKESEDVQVLLRPLFITSFMIDDFLDDNQFFGAQTVLISSASSKTAYGLAFMLSLRKGKACKVVGLTSAGNLGFVRNMAIYDEVISYDQVTELAADQGVVYVDMAGNGQLRSQLHHHFKDNMKYSCAVGGTHWEELSGGSNLPGAKPTLFFAPAQIKKRMTDWGPNGVQSRLAEAWQAFMQPVMAAEKPWMQVIHGQGETAVRQVYDDMLGGAARPDQGNVLTLLSGDTA